MTESENMDLEDLARKIKYGVHKNGSEQGTMSYLIEPSRIEMGKNFKFTYKFLDETAEESRYLPKDDCDFTEYFNNPEETGVEILALKLGGLEVTSLNTIGETTSIKVSKPMGQEYDTPETNSQETLEYNKTKMGNRAIRKIRDQLKR